jgi:hypothetical protein
MVYHGAVVGESLCGLPLVRVSGGHSDPPLRRIWVLGMRPDLRRDCSAHVENAFATNLKYTHPKHSGRFNV